MDNRPHSRKKVISSGSSSVGANSSSSSNRTSTNRPFIGGGQGRKGSSLLIVIIMIVIYSFMNLNNKPSSNNITPTQNQNTNNYAQSNNYEVNRNVSASAREKYTKLTGNDTTTLMIYMIGSDLESKYGMATKDLNEILYGYQLNDNLNVVIETGGASTWRNNVISNRTIQRYTITKNGLTPLENNVYNKSMTEEDTLYDFIKYSNNNYPADRNILILWDHGGGSIGGFGYDEKFKGSSLSIDRLANALKRSKVKFDIVGFDACLMATLETAISLEPYADYLLASEEVEPGNGWYYTNWIKELSSNTSINTLDLSKLIIDDYIANSDTRSQLTLSLTDLSELSGTLPSSLTNFSKNISSLLKDEQYGFVSNARANTKEFASYQKLDQIDLVDFANNIGTDEAKDLANTIKEAVKYNRYRNIDKSNGLSIYFPYSNKRFLSSADAIYENIEIGDEYRSAISSFAAFNTGGQIYGTNNGGNSLFDVLMNNVPSSSNSNVDILSLLTNSLDSNMFNGIDLNMISNFIGKNSINNNSIQVSTYNNQDVVHLSEEEWKLINKIELNVLVKEGNGYIDLGLDNVFEFNERNDLIVDFDGTWLALDGNIVSYRLLSDEKIDNDYITKGYIPAYVNGDLSNIIVQFSESDPYGRIIGKVESNDLTTLSKMSDLESGDSIVLVADYYENNNKGIIEISDAITYDPSFRLTNIDVANNDFIYSYKFSDIYNNSFWINPIQYSK